MREDTSVLELSGLLMSVEVVAPVVLVELLVAPIVLVLLGSAVLGVVLELELGDVLKVGYVEVSVEAARDVSVELLLGAELVALLGYVLLGYELVELLGLELLVDELELGLVEDVLP